MLEKNPSYSAAIYRGDWLKALGIDKEPETFEEFEKIMYSFANDDPDGNGKKDTYGISDSGLDAVYSAFASSSGLSGSLQLTPDDAIDGIDDTAWLPLTGMPDAETDGYEYEWIAVELTREYTVNEVRFLLAGADTLNGYNVEVSDNGENWNTVKYYQGQSLKEGEWITEQIDPVSTKFLRIVFTSNLDSKSVVGIGELQVFSGDEIADKPDEDSKPEEVDKTEPEYIYFPDIEGTQLQTAVYELAMLGIVEGYEDDMYYPDRLLTRSEFVTLILRAMAQPIYEGGTLQFTDVPSDHYAYGAIYTASEMGLVQGYDEFSFRPEDNISLQEALKILVAMLGYDSDARKIADCPEGYIAQAAMLNITSSVKDMDHEDKVSRGVMAMLLYDSLDADVSVKTMITPDKYELNRDMTLREYILDKKDWSYVKGVVTNTHNSTRDLEKSLAENAVEIDNNICYTVDDLGTEKFLGKMTASVFNKDDEIIGIVEICDENKVSQLPVYSVYEVGNGRLRYTDENNRNRSVILDNDVSLVYNGVTVSSFTESDLMLENGRYTLVDNDKDSEIDFIFIENDEFFFVEKTYSDTKTIFIKNTQQAKSESLSLEDSIEDGICRIRKNGKAAGFDDIKSYVILKRSKNGKCLEVNIPDTVREGKLTGIDESSSTMYIDEEAVSYLRNDANSGLSVGKSYSFIEWNGIIAGCEVIDKSQDLYYYVDSHMSDSDSLNIRVLGTDESLEMASRLRCGDVILYSTDNYDRIDKIEIVAEFPSDSAPFHYGEMTDNEVLYGYVYNYIYEKFMPDLNTKIDIIDMALDEQALNLVTNHIDIYKQPSMYLYEDGKITPTDSSNIVTMQQTGDLPEIFVTLKYGVIQNIILIK